jgi:hypothetical protein
MPLETDSFQQAAGHFALQHGVFIIMGCLLFIYGLKLWCRHGPATSKSVHIKLSPLVGYKLLAVCLKIGIVSCGPF